MKKTINIQFELGQEVVLKTDIENKRMVSGYIVRPDSIAYGLVLGDNESWHQAIEIKAYPKPFKVKGFHDGKNNKKH